MLRVNDVPRKISLMNNFIKRVSSGFIMKFILFVIDSTTRSPHSREEMMAIDALNEEMERAGHRLFACGLDSPQASQLIDFRGISTQLEQGTLMGLQEFYSGFWIVDVPNKEQAEAYAIKGSMACQRKIELRPIL